MAVVRMRRGQITIPAEVRKAANVKDGDAFAVTYDAAGSITAIPFDPEHPAEDAEYWAARGTATTLSDGSPLQRLTTEEFFALLDSVESAPAAP